MATIRAKKAPVIKKGNGYNYVPAEFQEKHKVANFHTVDDPQIILDNIKPFEFEGMKCLIFDTETHPYFNGSHVVPECICRRWVGSGKKAVPQDYPFCISICDGTNAYSILDTPENRFEKFRALSPLFEDADVCKIAHNIKFDMHMLANIDMKIVGRIHDTVVLAKLADENRKSFALRDLAEADERGIVKFEYMVDAYKQNNKISDYTDIPKELLCEYANADVWNCYLTFIKEYAKVKQDELIPLYDNECEVSVVLYAMERYGMRIDADYEEPLKADLQMLTDEAERKIYEEAGRLFNINSTKQLYEVLLGLGVRSDLIGHTAKGNPSLDKKSLTKLADMHDVSIVKNILEFRKNEKLLNTYAIGIYAQHDAKYKVHASINQTEATTGRMSITKPALQTLPKKDKRIRSAFIPEDGFSLVFMDLDQVEYRLFAHYAQIPLLLEQIRNGYDVHAATAANLFGKDIDKVVDGYHGGDEEMCALRSRAKTLNFALIYGMGNDALANDLHISKTEAADIKAKYFSAMPQANQFIRTVHKVIQMRSFVKNHYGRRRRLTSDECYKAPNSLIQGCAADYIKFKLVDIYKFLKYNNLETYMSNIVHDEIVICLADGDEKYIPMLRWLLSDFDTFRCPITAGCEFGNVSWGNKIEKGDVGFEEPTDKSYLECNVHDGSVFDIYKEA